MERISCDVVEDESATESKIMFTPIPVRRRPDPSCNLSDSTVRPSFFHDDGFFFESPPDLVTTSS